MTVASLSQVSPLSRRPALLGFLHPHDTDLPLQDHNEEVHPLVGGRGSIVISLLLCICARQLVEQPSNTLLFQENNIRHTVRNARLQSLDSDDEDPNAVDFCEESGVAEAIDSTKDNISNIKAKAERV